MRGLHARAGWRGLTTLLLFADGAGAVAGTCATSTASSCARCRAGQLVDHAKVKNQQTQQRGGFIGAGGLLPPPGAGTTPQITRHALFWATRHPPPGALAQSQRAERGPRGLRKATQIPVRASPQGGGVGQKPPRRRSGTAGADRADNQHRPHNQHGRSISLPSRRPGAMLSTSAGDQRGPLRPNLRGGERLISGAG